jgi:RNA polymerase sigma factor (sigma-70 family)
MDEPSSGGDSGAKINQNALSAYLREIRRYSLLTTSGERRLAVRTQRGEEGAWHDLVQSNLRLVVKIAKKYRYGIASLEDLIEEGNIGLMEAARRFDPTRGVRFGSYASWWIRKYIRAAVNRQRLQSGFPIAPLASIMSSGGVSGEVPARSRTDAAMRLWRRIMSFEEFPRGSSGRHPIESRVAASDLTPDEQVNEIQVGGRLREVLELLSEKERYILEARHGLNGTPRQSLQQIADEMGCTREWVRQLEQRALSRARNILESRRFRH